MATNRRPEDSRSSSASFTGALAAPHYLASEAGLCAYRDGGNAIDAAIAAAAVLTVVYPHNVALGGDLIALVRAPDGNLSCINASGWAAERIVADDLRTSYGTALPARCIDTVTVPGGVRGWEALRRFGARLSWDRTLRPAQDAAQVGTPVASSLAAHIARAEASGLSEDFGRVFCPAGQALQPGDRLVQSELAESIAALRENGPDEFYTGRLAERMVKYLGLRGSSLAAGDFAEFDAEIVAPLELTFRGLTVLTSPPNTHGFLLLRALAAIDELDIIDPVGEGFGSLMELFREGNRLRTDALADPRHAAVDIDTLVHGALGGVVAQDGSGDDPDDVAHGDTVGVAAADSDGYAVSLIQSVFYSFGSGFIDPATGILFHNRGAGFSLRPDSPNVIAPRKRPAHTLMPVITMDAGTPRHVLATRGGQGQPQILAQVLLRAMNGESAEDAIAAPRAVIGQQLDGNTADTVAVESDIGARVRAALAASDLATVEVPPHTEALGQTNAIFIGRDRSMVAASDPRSEGQAFVTQYPRPVAATGVPAASRGTSRRSPA